MSVRDEQRARGETGARDKHGKAPNQARRQNGPFDPSLLGMAAHELIAQLAESGLRDADFELIVRAVREHRATQAAAVYRQAARQWLLSNAMVYVRLFAPPPGWSFLGAEMPGRASRFDIVWQDTSTGSVLLDELKTGKAGDLVGGALLDAQLERERRDAGELYGDRFLGIRLLVLAAPRRSFFVSPDARRSLLYPEMGA